MRLVIVGNGFELAHKKEEDDEVLFDTSYKAFIDYLENSGEFEVLELLGSLSDDYGYEHTYWNEFEHDLAKIDFEKLSSLDVYSGFSFDEDDYDDNKELIKVNGEDFFKLKYLFCEWLLRKNDELEELADKKHYVSKLVSSFSKNDLFLSFNFSQALEILYEFYMVYNIHGNVDSLDGLVSEYSDLDSIVLGHYIPESDSLDFDSLDNLNPTVFEQLEKNTQRIIDNENFFTDLLKSKDDIEEVYVLGQSISKEDSLYFAKIIEILGTTPKWYLSEFEDDFKAKKNRLLEICSDLIIEKCRI